MGKTIKHNQFTCLNMESQHSLHLATCQKQTQLGSSLRMPMKLMQQLREKDLMMLASTQNQSLWRRQWQLRPSAPRHGTSQSTFSSVTRARKLSNSSGTITAATKSAMEASPQVEPSACTPTLLTLGAPPVQAAPSLSMQKLSGSQSPLTPTESSTLTTISQSTDQRPGMRQSLLRSSSRVTRRSSSSGSTTKATRSATVASELDNRTVCTLMPHTHGLPLAANLTIARSMARTSLSQRALTLEGLLSSAKQSSNLLRGTSPFLLSSSMELERPSPSTGTIIRAASRLMEPLQLERPTYRTHMQPTHGALLPEMDITLLTETLYLTPQALMMEGPFTSTTEVRTILRRI